MAYFPMFINLEKKRCLVVGGGTVALRKVQVLLDFGADVVVVAPEVEKEILSQENVTIFLREFEESDLDYCTLVIAATDHRDANHHIAEVAKAKGIAVNAVDQKEDCTFLFPSYIKEQNLVGAFSSGGNSPLLTQYLKRECSGILTKKLGEINECMGNIREIVKSCVADEVVRKQVYESIFKEILSKKRTELRKEELHARILEIESKYGTRGR